MTNLEIDEQRRERYLYKLDNLDNLIIDLENWHQGVEDLLEDKSMRRAVYKTFQEASEIISDLCAMYISDSQKAVGDDSSNIEKCSGNLFSDDLNSKLVEINGLRNRIVHDYNGFNDRTALESIENNIETLESFSEDVRKWIEKQ